MDDEVQALFSGTIVLAVELYLQKLRMNLAEKPYMLPNRDAQKHITKYSICCLFSLFTYLHLVTNIPNCSVILFWIAVASVKITDLKRLQMMHNFEQIRKQSGWYRQLLWRQAQACEAPPLFIGDNRQEKVYHDLRTEAKLWTATFLQRPEIMWQPK